MNKLGYKFIQDFNKFYLKILNCCSIRLKSKSLLNKYGHFFQIKFSEKIIINFKKISINYDAFIIQTVLINYFMSVRNCEKIITERIS